MLPYRIQTLDNLMSYNTFEHRSVVQTKTAEEIVENWNSPG